jgi:hypothetical protein
MFTSGNQCKITCTTKINYKRMKQKECNVKQPASLLFGVCTAAYFALTIYPWTRTTSFWNVTLYTLADTPFLGPTDNFPYTSCCIFNEQIPNLFRVHQYLLHLHFPASYSGVSTSIFLHFLSYLFIYCQSLFSSQVNHLFPAIHTQPILIH